MSFLILDIETVPDGDLILRAENKEIGTYLSDLQEEKGSDFVPLAYHKIICLAGVLISERHKLIKASVLYENVAAGLWASWRDRKPTLVGWNSRGFDLPCLELAGSSRD